MSHAINSYQHAIKFIQSHGHFATLTADGVLARSEAVFGDNVMKYMPDDNDNFMEELMVFPVDHEGNVKARDVRNWLGY